MDVTDTKLIIGFGAMDITKAYKFIGSRTWSRAHVHLHPTAPRQSAVCFRWEAPKIRRGICGAAAPETLCAKSLDCQNRGPDAPQRP